MKGSSLGYLTKEGFRNVYKNRLMSVASISVLFSCMVMIGLSFLMFVNINNLIGGVEQKNVIVVFVKVKATEKQTETLGEKIRGLSNVSGCEFVSKEAAFAAMVKELQIPDGLLSGRENEVPASFNVTIKDMNQYDETAKAINKLDSVQSLRLNSELAKTLSSVRLTVGKISAAIIGLLLFVSLFIIANTIKVTMFSRKLEISIMKSVGATNWFIRWPFMLEGMILGALSGVTAFFAVWGIYKLAANSVQGMLSGIGAGKAALPFNSYAVIIILSFLAIGFITGAFGSSVSISKYLKEQECESLE